MADPATLRAEADVLARRLDGLRFSAQRAEAPHIGAAGRRRAGTGEHFWQYRHYVQEDSAQRIDWRRSARSDDLFVRETELETARTILFWCDPAAGFHWSGTQGQRTKSADAILIFLAVATLLGRAGERIGVLGGDRAPSHGGAAVDRLAEGLIRTPDTGFPPAPRRPALAVLASDFYAPAETWRTRLATLGERCRDGVLLRVTDPVERDFPFEGRVELSAPGQARPRLLGRAETLRDAYLERFRTQCAEIDAVASTAGWSLVDHVAGGDPLPAAASLKAALERFGQRARTAAS